MFIMGTRKVEQQMARFHHRQDAAPQQAAEIFPEDPDYPYDMSPIEVPGWTVSVARIGGRLDPWLARGDSGISIASF